MVRRAIIGKKLLAGADCPPGRASHLVVPLGLGARLRARVRAQEAGLAIFLQGRSHDSVPSTVTISCYLLSDDERIQPWNPM
ncbi:MAG: hypothetical protein WAW52_11700 [Methanothrix sp.]